jgi:hypothetical protein
MPTYRRSRSIPKTFSANDDRDKPAHSDRAMTAARRRAARVRSSRHNRAWLRCRSRCAERASRASRSTAIPPPATGANVSTIIAASAQDHGERKNPSRSRQTRTSSSPAKNHKHATFDALQQLGVLLVEEGQRHHVRVRDDGAGHRAFEPAKVPTRNTLPLWTTCALQRPRLGYNPANTRCGGQGLPDRPPLWHRLGPRDMALEAKRSRHVAVAIPAFAIAGIIAVSLRQQCAQPQQQDVAHS